MRRGIVLLALIAVIAPWAFAEGPELSVEGVVINAAILPFPVPMGADLQLGLPLASPGGLPLTAVLRLRAGYEDLRFLRDDATGNPIAAPKDLGLNYFMSPNFQWAAGFVQAIIPAQKANLLEAFLFYRGRYDIYNPDLSTSVFSDAQGLFGSSVLVGLGYDALAKDSRRVRSGIGAEASAEWGPGGRERRDGFLEAKRPGRILPAPPVQGAAGRREAQPLLHLPGGLPLRRLCRRRRASHLGNAELWWPGPQGRPGLQDQGLPLHELRLFPQGCGQRRDPRPWTRPLRPGLVHTLGLYLLRHGLLCGPRPGSPPSPMPGES